MTTLRRMTVYLVAVTSVLLMPGTPAFAVNPIVKRFAADPSILVSGNRMYIYATDDASNSGSYVDGTIRGCPRPPPVSEPRKHLSASVVQHP